jgi:hypothetical protein
MLCFHIIASVLCWVLIKPTVLRCLFCCAEILPSMAGEAQNAYDARAYDSKMQEL